MDWFIQLEEVTLDLIIIEHITLFENQFIVFAMDTFSQVIRKHVDAILNIRKIWSESHMERRICDNII